MIQYQEDLDMGFVHIHNHSDYSLLDGAAPIAGLIKKAKEFGMQHLALTDHGNMFGSLRFYMACKDAGINPIVGCEVYISPESRHNRDKDFKYYHMILIAKNTTGYQNLMKLVSIAYVEGFYFRPRIDDEILQKYSEGLICTAACIAGEIPQLILRGDYQKAKERALFYKGIFKDDYYFEIQRHGIKEEEISNQALIKLANEIDVPLIATNDIHYLEKEHWFAHDILLCIGTGSKLEDEKRFAFPTHEFYFKSPNEMEALFSDVPQAIENTIKLAEKCNLEIPKPGPILPVYEIPKEFDSAENYIRHLVDIGLKKRYKEVTPQIRERAETEMNVIFDMNGESFAGYFLIVWDFIHYAKEHDIPVGPGRGSGAGSIVAYAMEITDIDPLKYNLLFERFLNPERISMPDFDIDFCEEGREDVLNYVSKKYGEEKVGAICTFGTLKTKAVLKDIARVLDIPFDESNQITKMVPEKSKTIEQALKESPELQAFQSRGGKYKTLFEVASVLENLNRNVSTHACGTVIGREELTKYVPLYYDPKKKKVASEYTMDIIEPRGLVKMDFLGLKTLTIIRNTQRIIKKNNPNFSIDEIPEDDPKTFKMLCEGKSEAVFQFESAGMQKILKEAKPNNIEDLIALNALYRPGPMDYIPQYIDAKLGRKKINYPHPDLEEVLAPTYGIIVYQEQVMKVAQIIGGFSLGKADILRRAMSKKKADEMAKLQVEFEEGAVKKGYTKEKANEIFNILIPFANYGFNKSHAAAYSVVAYKTAYLKANYPAEFMAANLTNEIGGQDKAKFPLYLDLCKRVMGIEILPPNINLSDMNFTVKDGKIYYGLKGIKKVGEVAVKAIIEERETNGSYKNFFDFMERVDLRVINKGVIEALIQSGVFDNMGFNRATLMFNIENLLNHYGKMREHKQFNQCSLFDDGDKEVYPDPIITPQQEFPKQLLLEQEKEFVGTYCSGHPMDEFMQIWEKTTTLDLTNLKNFIPNRIYQIIGIVKEVRTFDIKKPGKNFGKKMANVTIEDPKGSLRCTFWPDSWEQARNLVSENAILAFKGKVVPGRGEEDDPQMVVDQLDLPKDLNNAKQTEVHIRLKPNCDQTQVISLKEFVCENNGSCELFFHIPESSNLPNNKVSVVRAHKTASISNSPQVIEGLKSFLIVEDVWSQ